MINRKSILTVLVTAVGLILVYNYIIAPYLMQNNPNMGMSMGMGMHWGMYSYPNYFIDNRITAIIAIFIAGILLFGLIRPKNGQKKCVKCGSLIESERWKVCPDCGTPIKRKENNK